MHYTRLPVATAAVALTLSFTACGGGDTLSKSELTSKANAICKDIEAKVKAVDQPSSGGTDALAQYFDKLAPYTKDLESRLKDLKPGDDTKADYTKLTDSISDAVASFQKVSDAAKSKDEAAFKQAGADIEKSSDASDAAAKKLSLTECD